MFKDPMYTKEKYWIKLWENCMAVKRTHLADLRLVRIKHDHRVISVHLLENTYQCNVEKYTSLTVCILHLIE